MPQNIYDNPEFFAGYRKLRETSAGLNDVLEQPAIRALLPELSGLDILDLGCGAGEFAHYCIERGARRVVGVDISEKMLEVARRDNGHERIEYIRAAMEDAQFPVGSFDLVVSSFALHYVKDYDTAVAKIWQWLKTPGILVYSTEHPIATACKDYTGWVRGTDGTKIHWAVDNYGEEGPREQRWIVEGVVKYHRTLSTLINELIGVGFLIEHVGEPGPIEEAVGEKPNLAEDWRRPPVLVIRASWR